MQTSRTRGVNRWPRNTSSIGLHLRLLLSQILSKFHHGIMNLAHIEGAAPISVVHGKGFSHLTESLYCTRVHRHPCIGQQTNKRCEVKLAFSIQLNLTRSHSGDVIASFSLCPRTVHDTVFIQLTLQANECKPIALVLLSSDLMLLQLCVRLCKSSSQFKHRALKDCKASECSCATLQCSLAALTDFICLLTSSGLVLRPRSANFVMKVAGSSKPVFSVSNRLNSSLTTLFSGQCTAP